MGVGRVRDKGALAIKRGVLAAVAIKLRFYHGRAICHATSAKNTACAAPMLAVLALSATSYAPLAPRRVVGHRAPVVSMDGEFDPSLMLGPGQKFGPTAPAHPAEK